MEPKREVRNPIIAMHAPSAVYECAHPLRFERFDQRCNGEPAASLSCLCQKPFQPCQVLRRLADTVIELDSDTQRLERLTLRYRAAWNLT